MAQQNGPTCFSYLVMEALKTITPCGTGVWTIIGNIDAVVNIAEETNWNTEYRRGKRGSGKTAHNVWRVSR